jgi:hypothetical protein
MPLSNRRDGDMNLLEIWSSCVFPKSLRTEVDRYDRRIAKIDDDRIREPVLGLFKQAPEIDADYLPETPAGGRPFY